MNERVLPINASTGTISYKILIEGKELSHTVELLQLTTHKEVNRIPFARMVFRDGDAAKEDFEVSNTKDLIPGKKIEIQAGYDSNDKTIFKGIIIKHRVRVREYGISTLEIECRDEAVKMTIGRKNKYFTKKKDSDVISTLIKDHGLKAKVEATKITHDELIQYYSTDWDFVLSRAEMNGQLVIPNDGEVTTQIPKVSGKPALSLIHGDTIYDFEAEMDARFQYEKVKTRSWDFKKQKVLEGEGKAPTKYPQGNLSEKDLAKVIGLKTLEMQHSGQIIDKELKVWADAQLIKSQLSKIVGTVKSRGFPSIKPSDVIELAGVGERFNGKAYVTGVRQELKEGTWYTTIQFGKSPEWCYHEFEITERPASGLVPGINGLQIGVVTKLEGDPDGEFRIKVVLPLIDPKNEGIWARLASLDAGKERGYVFRPEIKDEVIVGFINDDPRDAVVLGMLHSSAMPAPIPAKDDNDEKGLTTRSKMRLHFDDKKKILTIETPAGKKVVLDEDGKNIRLEDENKNKIILDSKGILLDSGKDIVLKAKGNVKIEGVNVQQKAKAQFKAEGSAGLEVSSSAILTVKGSLVKIN